MGRFLSRLISVNSHWEVGALRIDLSSPAFSFPIQIFSKDTIMMVMIMMMLLLMYKMATLMMGSPTNFPHCTSDLNPASLSCHELSPVSLHTNCPMQCHTASPHDFLKSFIDFPALLQMSDLNPSTLSWHDSSPLTLLSLHCRILPRPGAKIALKFMPGTCSAAIWCPQPIHNTDKVKGRSKEKSLYFGAAIVSWHNNRYKCLKNKLIN